MQAEQINNYFRMLEKENWTYTQYRADNEVNWWMAKYKTPRRRIEVYVGSGQNCLFWQLPLAIRPVPTCRPALYRYLLQLNHELKLAKFSLDSNDHIHLTAEILGGTCAFSIFQQVLTALHTYFEQYHREIELMATSPDLAKAWLSLSPSSEEPKVEFLS